VAGSIENNGLGSACRRRGVGYGGVFGRNLGASRRLGLAAALGCRLSAAGCGNEYSATWRPAMAAGWRRSYAVLFLAGGSQLAYRRINIINGNAFYWHRNDWRQPSTAAKWRKNGVIAWHHNEIS